MCYINKEWIKRIFVFNDEKDTNNEVSFAETYRSQILHPDDDIEDDSSRNLIIISILVIIVLALGIFGYKYLSQSSQTGNSETEEVKALTVKEPVIEKSEEESIEPPESTQLNNIEDLMNEEEDTNSTKPKIETKKEEKAKTSKQKAEDTYLEQLAELSKEIDGEK